MVGEPNVRGTRAESRCIMGHAGTKVCRNRQKKAAEGSAAFLRQALNGLFKLGAQEGTRTPTKLLAST
jgi:hypothetical protein